MNTTKKILIAVIIIICNFSSYAQREKLSKEELLKSQQRTIKEVTFIFEGVATKQEGYLTKKKEPFTCTTIQITKIFKGSPQIKLGTIKVITEGRPDDIISDGGDTKLYTGLTFIIMASIANPDILPNNTITTDNPQSLLITSDVIRIADTTNKRLYHKGTTPMATWYETKYNTLDDLYTFLKEKCSLTIQEETKK
ncbi:MAG: hypothetical protein WCP52_02675 [Bacteroidota bacterium]